METLSTAVRRQGRSANAAQIRAIAAAIDAAVAAAHCIC
jgi:hypothetical protein